MNAPSSSPVSDPHAPLRDDVRLLGHLLGDTLRQQVGEALYDKVEAIRKLAKQTRDGDTHAGVELNRVLSALEDHELSPVARAFTQFLNLANIAEQYHRVRRRRAAFAGAAQGTDRLRQDALRRTYGLALEAATGDRGLSRRSDHGRSGGALPDCRQSDGLGRWATHGGSQSRCHMLSG